jgi:hypothetical protein
VFNALPFARKEMVAVPLQELSRMGGADIGIYDDGTMIPTQIDNGCIYFRSEVGGFGYRSYTSKKMAPVGLSRSENCDNCVLENDAVRVEINADGTIPSFIYKADSTELLNADAPGNELRGLLLGDNEQTWISNRGAADDSTISRGELFDRFRCTGAIKGVPYKMNVVLPHDDQPVLEFILELSFNGEKIGDFWDDETKLHLLWPLRLDTPTLTHDVPFGVELGKKARPLFATNWIDLSAENHGFTLYNTGMVKHWVRGSTIANLLAWGGERFSNRSGVAGYECTPRTRQYLHGTHVFRYFINLHAGNWMEGGVTRIAQRINSPQVCAIVKKGKSGP